MFTNDTEDKCIGKRINQKFESIFPINKCNSINIVHYPLSEAKGVMTVYLRFYGVLRFEEEYHALFKKHRVF